MCNAPLQLSGQLEHVKTVAQRAIALKVKYHLQLKE